MRTLILALTMALVVAAARADDLDRMRGDRVGWARLQTPSGEWNRHSRSDHVLAEFLRDNTSLNIDPTWYAANVNSLDELSKYPVVFAQAVDVIQSPESKANLAEYIRRGGFVIIDACISPRVNTDPDAFLARQELFLSEILPESRIVALDPSHDIFRCYFLIPGGVPPHTFARNIYDPRWARHGLYALMIGPRMAGIISLSGLQCGWDRMIAPPGHPEECMRMLVNIYTYAMMQAN